MQINEKVMMRKRIDNNTGVKLTIPVMTELEEIIDERERKIQKDFWLTKIGIRGIYVVIFGIIGTYSLFFIDWKFTSIMAVIAIYNLIHTLSHWVFYRNNFTVNNGEKKN